ncbi:E2/UBC family protein [Argonema antarcticum]|uniref:E2/UBC family protein n=1 Tax=Argonema antarcticum TaxID=2942763 RepID=UPI002011362B|nr:E2/UBC family protein [Argonema antarcticum]MCL1475741.1 hypothetical protein [Argonema antarcticum A004/B2]
MRQQFRLPSDNEEYLNARSLSWETVIDNRVQRVIVYDFPVPPGYDRNNVDLNLRIETGYPDAQIDMVYFHPPLARSDGRPIKAITTEQFDGKQWQRWSRHRSVANPWRPGIDCIATHLGLVEEWLKKELTTG